MVVRAHDASCWIRPGMASSVATVATVLFGCTQSTRNAARQGRASRTASNSRSDRMRSISAPLSLT